MVLHCSLANHCTILLLLLSLLVISFFETLLVKLLISVQARLQVLVRKLWWMGSRDDMVRNFLCAFAQIHARLVALRILAQVCMSRAIFVGVDF